MKILKFMAETEQERDKRIAAKHDWSPWFAWYPVKVAKVGIVWLETVERRRSWFRTYYRAISSPPVP